MAQPYEKKPRLVLGVRYAERGSDPPPGLTWRKVKNNETLGSIADEYGIRWLDLALYNFHTVKPEEINWYLRHFVGCRRNNGKWYIFSLTDKPGMLLVPDLPNAVKKGPAKSADAVRSGTVTQDTKLQVYVVERLADGSMKEVSGKWLYVFSGGPNLDFGYLLPPVLIKTSREGAASPDKEPGSAFTLDYPGAFPITEKPEKLEYEIYVTGETPVSNDLVKAVSGQDVVGTPHYKVGGNWHFLSDQQILKRSMSEDRAKRTSHALRNAKVVTIDLAPKGQPRRYYFLLSPVQLGPKALQYALDHPQGLTPLLKPDTGTTQWDPQSASGPSLKQSLGPKPQDVRSGTLWLPVIDPYAWAENIAEKGYADSVAQYVKWFSSQKNATLKKLQEDTGWTIDQYSLAQILRSVRDKYSKPPNIDKRIKNPDQWVKHLQTWQQELIQRNAEITASAHRSLLQILEWLDGPGHMIIETALLKDTTAGSPQDSIDIARGILHWAVCTENLIALEPGILYLQDVLVRPGALPYDAVLKHFKDLDEDKWSVTLTQAQQKSFQYAYQGILKLLALKDFVADAPKIPPGGSRQDYLMKLADYQYKRRDRLVKFLNALKILPVEVKAPPKMPPAPKEGAWGAGSAAFNALLDLMDKWTTYIIEPDIKIPRNNRILNWLADLEVWFDKRPTLAKIANMGTSYALKSFALVVSNYNLLATITTARYDYQKSVTATDWLGAGSGAVLAIQDALAEVAVLTGGIAKRETVQKLLPKISQWLAQRASPAMVRVFPQLMVTAGGPSWGVGAASITGIAGRTFATVNVLAMFVSGVITMVSMYKGFTQAKSRGDYTAAAFYLVGAVGGLAMTAGAVCFGLALMKVGGVFFTTGPGATIGVVLFALGGIVAGVAALVAYFLSSDDYEVFAEKCFLGKDGTDEPRWDDPPAWAHAAKVGPNSWPIEKQRRALFNLLGRFQLKTKPEDEFKRNQRYRGRIRLEIKPGLFNPGSSVEVVLQYGKADPETSAAFRWSQYEKGSLQSSAPAVLVKKGTLFDVDAAQAWFDYTTGSPDIEKIKAFLSKLNYDGEKDPLVTTVTIRYPDVPNTIRARKVVMRHGALYGVTIDDNEVTSDLYE